ncbi:MAG: hypothetical protein QXH07_03165 [Thermoplasmata archaeon]
MTILKNFLPNNRVEIIFLTSDDIPMYIYELDTLELAEFEKLLSEIK